MKRKVVALGLTLTIVMALSGAHPGSVCGASEERGKPVTVHLPGGATMEMVWIEPGTFVMGSPEDEPGRYGHEGPQHEVTITQGFWLGKYELTQAQWESAMGTRPWAGEDHVREHPNHPAAYISWEDVQAFIAKLNEAEGSEVYRLPTEAEWEYACRAGTTTRWSFGDDESQLGEYAWYKANTWDVGEGYAHAVGTKLPNPWGLYDMHGNVFEWCQDWIGPYSGSPQTDPTGSTSGLRCVQRGGDFHYAAGYVRSALRLSSLPSDRYAAFGARPGDRMGTFGARLVRMQEGGTDLGGNPGRTRDGETAAGNRTWGQIKHLFE